MKSFPKSPGRSQKPVTLWPVSAAQKDEYEAIKALHEPECAVHRMGMPHGPAAMAYLCTCPKSPPAKEQRK